MVIWIGATSNYNTSSNWTGDTPDAPGETATFAATGSTTVASNTGSAKFLYRCDATSGNIIANLPAAASCNGMPLAFKKTDASVNTVIVTPNGTEKIDGQGDITLTDQYQWLVIISNGTGWDDVSATPSNPITIKSINVQTFTTSGTYTPTTGMLKCIVEMVGGGGGGGGTQASFDAASGGASGGYIKALLTAAQVGASQTITVGAGGAGGSTSGGAGGNGGATSVGSLLSCGGGNGSSHSGQNNYVLGPAGGSVTVSTGTPISIVTGQAGGLGGQNTTAYGGSGGSNPLGVGGPAQMSMGTNMITNAGTDGVGYGSGGSGAMNATNSAGVAGGAGKDGVVIITEYCSV